MKELLPTVRVSFVTGMIAALALLASSFSVRANVYATDIQLNGSSQPPSASSGAPVAISYILSDTANLGVVINVFSNGAPIRTFSIATNAIATNGAGLSQGTNTVYWDGIDSSSNTAGVGAFNVSVTASSSGHATWTELTTNIVTTNTTSGGYYVWAARGLAVNTFTNDPAYGSVYVGNAQTGPNVTTVAGDHDGILMFNADGTAAANGEFADGGYSFHSTPNFSLPEKLRFADDDRLYMNDNNAEQIVAFDSNVQTNEVVLGENNYFANPFASELNNEVGWFSLDVTSASSTNNGRIWLGEYDAPGAGVWSWLLVNGVADPSDNSGSNNIAAVSNGSLNLDASGGLMVDVKSNVFVSQYVDTAGDTTDGRCMMFTNVNNVVPQTNAFWDVGAGDDTFRDVFDTTIDSRLQPHFVACAMSGPSVQGIRILNAADGSTAVANLDANNNYYATAWDAAGNLYAASDSLHAWRVWSPPGANSSTTLGPTTINTVNNISILTITNSGSQVSLTFAAPSTNAPSNFTLLASSGVGGNFSADASAVFGRGDRIGLFTVVAPVNGPAQFYLIKQ